MRNLNLRFLLSAVCLYSVMLAITTSVSAAPVQFNQVRQVVNPKPGKANTGGFSELRLNGTIVSGDDGDDEKKTVSRQDDRVITETRVEIVEDDVCDCVEETVVTRGFPKWALLGLVPIPLLFLFKKRETPTPPRTPPVTETPTPPITETPTPPTTTTPTPPEPVPEPMTILLFGTGLAGIGVAARKRFGKKEKQEEQN